MTSPNLDEAQKGVKQHYTQSAASQNLNMLRIARMTEEQAYQLLLQVRFADSFGRPICPHCGCDRVCVFRTRRVFKCKACQRQFSITSGTIWARRKLPFSTMLYMVGMFVSTQYGRASIQVARECYVAPMTAFVSCHKVREAMGLEMQQPGLRGVVEVDGCQVGGHLRKYNQRKWQMKRPYKQRKEKIRAICAARQRGGRILTAVTKHEREFVPIILENVERDAAIHSDEGSHWEKLSNDFDHNSVKHKVRYTSDTASTNMVECFFARVRRSQRGVYIKIADVNSDLYAIELAWRESNARVSDAARFLRVLHLTLTHPVSRRFKGYWQRRAKKRRAKRRAKR